MQQLLNELRLDLEGELFEEINSESDQTLLSSKIKNAYLKIRFKRNYQEHHEETFVDKDMKKLYPIIRELALYDWNTIGTEFQTGHSDNGISRSWESRDKILAQVIPFVNVL